MRYSIAMKWIDALRSGDYPQINGALRDENGFCCLGVLCNLHAKAHPEIAAEQTKPEEYLGENAGLPAQVIEWAGIKGGYFIAFPSGLRPEYQPPGTDDPEEKTLATSMTDLNDEAEWDFKKISTFIRKNYKLL